MRLFFVYRLTNRVNGKKYVGTAVAPYRRWQRHVVSARNGSNNAIHRAIRKHGPENFLFEIIENWLCTEAYIKRREIYWIERECSFAPLGYNMTRGGDGADDLGRLAAEAHAKRRAADPVADSADRSARTKKVLDALTPEERSARAKKAWETKRSREYQPTHLKEHQANMSPEARSKQARKAALTGTSEERSQRARKAAGALSDDQRRAAAERMRVALTPEKRRDISRKGHSAYMDKSTPGERSDNMRKAWVTRRTNQAGV